MENKTKSNIKIIIIILVAAIIVGILLAGMFTKGGEEAEETKKVDLETPKIAVEQYLGTFTKKDAAQLMNMCDYVGSTAWKKSYDIDNFTEADYNEFVTKYNSIDPESVTESKENDQSMYERQFEKIKEIYSVYELKVKEFKDVKCLGDKLYAVTVDITEKAEAATETAYDFEDQSTATYIIFNGKKIYEY